MYDYSSVTSPCFRKAEKCIAKLQYFSDCCKFLRVDFITDSRLSIIPSSLRRVIDTESQKNVVYANVPQETGWANNLVK